MGAEKAINCMLFVGFFSLSVARFTMVAVSQTRLYGLQVGQGKSTGYIVRALFSDIVFDV